MLQCPRATQLRGLCFNTCAFQWQQAVSPVYSFVSLTRQAVAGDQIIPLATLVANCPLDRDAAGEQKILIKHLLFCKF